MRHWGYSRMYLTVLNVLAMYFLPESRSSGCERPSTNGGCSTSDSSGKSHYEAKKSAIAFSLEIRAIIETRIACIDDDYCRIEAVDQFGKEELSKKFGNGVSQPAVSDEKIVRRPGSGPDRSLLRICSKRIVNKAVELQLTWMSSSNPVEELKVCSTLWRPAFMTTISR